MGRAAFGVNRTGTSIGSLVVSVVFGGPARWFVDKSDAGMNRLYSRDEKLHHQRYLKFHSSKNPGGRIQNGVVVASLLLILNLSEPKAISLFWILTPGS